MCVREKEIGILITEKIEQTNEPTKPLRAAVNDKTGEKERKGGGSNRLVSEKAVRAKEFS